jgi:cation:H+ antiporter
MILLNIAIFLISCFALPWLGSMVVGVLINIAKFLRLREFVVAFFVMAFAASLPNLFVDVNAALRGLPHLAFGDVVGGNMVDLTLVIALAVFLTRGNLATESRMVQTSAIFTAITAILPLLLIVDGNLSRGDGVVLILAFLLYIFWIFGKEERFKKVYSAQEDKPAGGVLGLLKNLMAIILFLGLLYLASSGIVNSAQYFSDFFGIPIATIGILVVGLGNCFPEMYFSFVSAKKDQNWMILGNIMGSVIICATLVLGIVVLISPFEIPNFSPFATARVFTAIAALYFLFATRTGRKITKKEAAVLLFIYILFVLVETLFLK